MLNAFRHQRKELCPPARPLFQKLAVLNAFRHQRKELSASLVASSMSDLCSTPFGINGRNSGSRAELWDTSRGAQRLSASTEGTRPEWRDCFHPYRCAQRLSASTEGTPACARWAGSVFCTCSTPFGINGRNSIGTTAKPFPRRCAQRLSASTEGTLQTDRSAKSTQECSTPFGINGRNSAGFALALGGGLVCSTPFGINGRNSAGFALALGGGLVCSTPFGINGRNSGSNSDGVGSWPSAQRLSASTEGTPRCRRSVIFGSMCSTPFGINGRNSTWPPFGDFWASMCSTPFGINGRNSRWPSRSSTGLTCSTPFGINGRNSSARCNREERLHEGAQRLSASTEGTLDPLATRPGRYGSAQRLSASTEGTLGIPQTGGPGIQVLNAFRHQRKELSIHWQRARPLW